MKKFFKMVDSALIFLILLSIIQLLIDQIALVYYSFDESSRVALIVSGFIFDLIFTLEFILRSIMYAREKGGFKEYFLYKNGWIDFMASVPLLLLNSGPTFFAFVVFGNVGGGRTIVNLLKVIKALRVTRILRILRVLKIFGKIENVSSAMSQHHISTISSILITSSISVYILLTATGLINISSEIVSAQFALILTLISIGNVLAISFIYAGVFAKNVSDPIYVIKRGMEEDDYMFTAKVNEHYLKDEVFQLAKIYNDVWIPRKHKEQMKAHQSDQLSEEEVDDYSDLF